MQFQLQSDSNLHPSSWYPANSKVSQKPVPIMYVAIATEIGTRTNPSYEEILANLISILMTCLLHYLDKGNYNHEVVNWTHIESILIWFKSTISST